MAARKIYTPVHGHLRYTLEWGTQRYTESALLTKQQRRLYNKPVPFCNSGTQRYTESARLMESTAAERSTEDPFWNVNECQKPQRWATENIWNI